MKVLHAIKEEFMSSARKRKSLLDKSKETPNPYRANLFSKDNKNGTFSNGTNGNGSNSLQNVKGISNVTIEEKDSVNAGYDEEFLKKFHDERMKFFLEDLHLSVEEAEKWTRENIKDLKDINSKMKDIDLSFCL